MQHVGIELGMQLLQWCECAWWQVGQQHMGAALAGRRLTRSHERNTKEIELLIISTLTHPLDRHQVDGVRLKQCDVWLVTTSW